MKNLTRKEKIYMAIFSLWLFINIILYYMSTPWKGAEFILYPFARDRRHGIDDYDFSEFLIYGISPFVLFTIYKLFLKKEQ